MMHGGWSAGPRTAEGMARMTAARTTRGKCSAPQRAMGRSVRTLPVRVRLCAAASLLKQYLLAEMAARLGVGLAESKAPALPDNRVVLKNPDTTPYNSLLAEMAARLGAGLSAGPAELKTRVLPDNRAVFEESRHYPMQQSAGGDGGAAAGHRGGSGGAGCGANCASRPHATVCGWAGWLHGGHDGCTEGAVVAARPSPSSLRGSTSPATSGRGIAGRYPRSSDWPPGGWRLPSRSRT
jgi:hypothetical protein